MAIAAQTVMSAMATESATAVSGLLVKACAAGG